MLRKRRKLDRQSDISPTLQPICQQFSDALDAVSNSAVKRTWDKIRTYIPEQLKHKSSTRTNKLENCLLVLVAFNHNCYVCDLRCMRL